LGTIPNLDRRKSLDVFRTVLGEILGHGETDVAQANETDLAPMDARGRRPGKGKRRGLGNEGRGR
jgi:hypothetical protein